MNTDLRAKELHPVLWARLSPEKGILRACEARWTDAACAQTIARARKDALRTGRYYLLRAAADAPGGDLEGFLRFLGALGDAARGDARLYGADVVLPACAREPSDILRVFCAYQAAFPGAFLFADVRNARLCAAARGCARAGALLDAREAYDDLGEALAQSGLAESWLRAPVRLIARDMSEALAREALRWHASLLDIPSNDAPLLPRFGGSLSLRRVYLPQAIARGGALCCRLWLVNEGNTYLYRPARFRLRLYAPGQAEGYAFPVDGDVNRLAPGADCVIEGEIPLRDVPEGEYAVHIGLFFEDTGEPVTMAVDGRISDGYVTLFTEIQIL